MRVLALFTLLFLLAGCGRCVPRDSDTSGTPGYANGYLEGHYAKWRQAEFKSAHYGD